MRHVTCFHWLMGLFLLALTLAGCQTAPPSAAKPPDPSAQAKPRPLTQPIDAADLMPKRTLRSQVTFSAGKRKGKTFDFTIEKTADGWTQTLAGQSVLYLQRHADGSIVATREDDLREKVAVHYDPYVVVVPTHLNASAHVAGSAKTQVLTLGDGSPRGSGTTTYTLEKIWQADLPASDHSTFDAYVVRETRVMDLDVAQVHLTIDTSYAPGQGQVGASIWEEQKTLGLFSSHKHWSFARSQSAK